MKTSLYHTMAETDGKGEEGVETAATTWRGRVTYTRPGWFEQTCKIPESIRLLAALGSMRMLFGFLAALLLAAVPARTADQKLDQVHQRQAAPKSSPRLTDSQLESLIRAKFAKSKINEDKFTVRVQGGIATVEGRTDIIQHKGVATRLCKTAGAIAVNNHIQISDAARQKAAGNLEQGRRRAQVQRGEPRSQPTPPRTR
jgi:hypothetical protein